MIKRIFSGFRLIMLVLFLAFLCGNYASENINSFFYAFSLTVRSIIVTFLPIAIFAFLSKGVSSMGNGVGRLFYVLLPTYIISVCSSVFYSYLIAWNATDVIVGGAITNADEGARVALQPMWVFNPISLYIPIPFISESQIQLYLMEVSNNIILLFSIAFGMYATFKDKDHYSNRIIEYVYKNVAFFFSNYFNMLIPFFIFGLFIQICYDDLLSLLLGRYLYFFLLYLVSSSIYLIAFGMIVFNMKKAKLLDFFQKTSPAVLVALTSMSSMVSMPIMMLAMDSTTKNKKVKNVIYPMIVNIHNIADNLLIPILLLLVMKQFEYPILLSSHIDFAISYMIIKLSGVCIPGGTAILILPILINKIGLTNQMISVFTACYLILDPYLTAFNTLFNGLFTHLTSDRLIPNEQQEEDRTLKEENAK